MTGRILLTFPIDSTGKPLVCQIIRDYSMELNILNATVDHDASGRMLAEVSGTDEDYRKMLGFLKDNGVGIRRVVSVVEVDKKKCVNCGACTAACAVGALTMNEAWELVHHAQKCLECTLCITACPVRAIHTLI